MQETNPKAEPGPMDDKWVAVARVTHGGYGMELSKFAAYALPEGDHKLYAAPVAEQGSPTDAEIRDVMLANGFTIKDGCDDLKPYVYGAARSLLRRHGGSFAAQAQSATGILNFSAQVIELYDDATMKEFNYMLDSTDCAAVLVALGGYLDRYPVAAASAQQHVGDSVEAQQTISDDPVAVVGDDFALLWAGSGPIAQLVKRHGIKVGSKLYAHPQAVHSAPVSGADVVLPAPYAQIGKFMDDSTDVYTADQLRAAVLSDRQRRGRVAQPQPSGGAERLEITGHNLKTSEGGRGFVADYFLKRIGRHDFTDYINGALAADFACVLAQHLDALSAQENKQ